MKNFANSYRTLILGLTLGLLAGWGTLQAQVSVTIPNISVLPDSSVTIPVNVGSLTGLNVTGFEFVISCDTNIVKFAGASASGTLSEGWSVVFNNSVGAYGPGKMKIVAANATPTSGSGALVNLLATAKNVSGSSALSVSNFLFNAGTPSATITNGSLRTNRAPTMTAVSAKTVAEKNALTFTATATDPDLPNDTLAFSLIGAPTGAAIVASTGVFSWVPNYGEAGSYSFKVKVTDLGAASDSTSVSVTVTHTNQKPSFVSKMRDTTVSDNVALAFTYTATDPDGSPTLTFKKESGPTGATVSSSGQFSWTPSSSQVGVSNVVVSVSDSSLADTAKAKITVNHVNRAPSFGTKMRDTTIVQGSTLNFTYAATDPDDGTTLSYKLESGLPGATVSSSGQFVWAPGTTQIGAFNVVVSVSDGALADTAKAKITVSPANRAPAFVLKLNDQTINEGSTLSFTYTATDPDAGAVLTFRLVNAPTGASITTAGVFTFTPPANPAASCLIVAVVSDGSLADTAKATVTVNRKPVFGSRTPSGTTPISRNVATTFTVIATDPDGNALTFTWKVDGTTEKTGDNTFTRTFTDAQGTPKVVRAIFADAGGLKDSTTWNFTITPVEDVGVIPTEYALGQNYPNPFNPSTAIRFDLPKQSPVVLEVYNILGVRIRTLLRGENVNAGRHQVIWDGRDETGTIMASGIYLYRISAGDFHSSRRMTLLK